MLNPGRGSGVVARQQAYYLLKKGHDVYFLQADLKEEVRGANNVNVLLHTNVIPVHEYHPRLTNNQKPVSDMSYKEASSYIPDYEKAVLSIANKVDVFLGHHGNLSAVVVQKAAKKYNKPYALFLHGTGIEPRLKGFYDDRVWEEIEEAIVGADKLIVTTDYVRDSLVRKIMPLPKDRFVLIPGWVDLNEFQPEDGKEVRKKYGLSKQYIIVPGALIQSKGPQNVLSASKYFGESTDLVFIGDGPLRSRLEKEAKKGVHFLGYVPDEDRTKLVNSATLLVAAPEKREHFGMIYIESLAAGVPPVAYEGGGVSTIVTPEVGILTKRNPDALGRGIKSILDNPKKRVKLGSNARVRAEKYFSETHLGDKLENCLTTLKR